MMATRSLGSLSASDILTKYAAIGLLVGIAGPTCLYTYDEKVLSDGPVGNVEFHTHAATYSLCGRHPCLIICSTAVIRGSMWVSCGSEPVRTRSGR